MLTTEVRTETPSRNRWRDLAIASHYQTAVAVRNELLAGDVEETIEGIEELIAALSRSDRRELSSQLVRLMLHIVKWKSQPARRSRSWLATINNARVEIEILLEAEPVLKPQVASLVDTLFARSKRLAEQEMGKRSTVASLAWSEIFEEEYEL
jgi:hypothetical protein